MADYEANIAPFINTTFYVTSVFGEDRGSRLHKGLDIATSGSVSMYSISNGQVILKQYDADGFGYYIIIKDENGLGFLYAHMQQESPLNVGDSVEVRRIYRNRGNIWK